MSDYKLLHTGFYQRLSDGAYISPNAPGNLDWELLQAWLKAGNTPDTDSSATAIADLKRQRMQENNNCAELRFGFMVNAYPPLERESWATLSIDAALLLETQDLLQVPALEIEAIARSGITEPVALLAEANRLATTVLGKRDALKLASGQVRGCRNRIENEITALTTLEALSAYNVAARWQALEAELA